MKKQETKSKVKTHLDRIRKLNTMDVEKRNARFNALSPLKKRVHIAAEAILMIDAGQFIPGDGYGKVPDPVYKHNFAQFPDGNLQKLLMDGITCVGCAKTAAVVARASLGNEVDRRRFGYTDTMAHKVSAEIFGEDLSNIIEALYEDSEFYGSRFGHGSEVLNGLCASLPSRKESPDKRMKAIYARIVKGDGLLKYRGKTFGQLKAQ